MQGKNTGKTCIIGGSYRECCSLDDTDVFCGSGVRAMSVFQTLNKDYPATFITCSGSNEKYIKACLDTPNTTLSVFSSPYDVTFFYEHPFRVSQISPRMDLLYQDRKLLSTVSDNILVFGMVEADFCVKGGKVVYDPQTSVMPLSFKASGSVAEHLVLCLNSHEAYALSGKKNLSEQRTALFDNEGCAALVIKDGSHGAYVFESKDDEGTNIPVYMTNHVHAIGTGDVFSAALAYSWFNGSSVVEAAAFASKAVACYAETGKVKLIPETMRTFAFDPLQIGSRKQIYLAGPFFSYAQRWLVNEFYNALKQEENPVFSPLHDVGYGDADEVTDLDIAGLDKAEVVLAIVDGLDSGTLFEVGYAIAKGKKVVAYTQNETEKSLQMLKGTHCDIENDFTTAIYKAIWYASK